MLDDLAIARGDGRLGRLLASWARVSVGPAPRRDGPGWAEFLRS